LIIHKALLFRNVLKGENNLCFFPLFFFKNFENKKLHVFLLNFSLIEIKFALDILLHNNNYSKIKISNNQYI